MIKIGEVVTQYENATITTQGELDTETGEVIALFFEDEKLGAYIESTFECITGEIYIMCPECHHNVLADSKECSFIDCVNDVQPVQQSLLFD